MPKNTDPKSARQAIQNLLCCRPVAYYPSLARCVGGVRAAVMLSQLLYWSSTKPDKPFYKSTRELAAETGLTDDEQETARKKLLECGAINAARRGWPATWHYQVDLDRVSSLLAGQQIPQLAESANSGIRQQRNPELAESCDSGIRQQRIPLKPRNRFPSSPNLSEGPINELNTENTTENTEEEERPVLENFAGIDEELMDQLQRLGVFDSKIPDVLRAMQAGWTADAIRDLIDRCKRDDRRGTPAALFLKRLSELKPPKAVYGYPQYNGSPEIEQETGPTLDDLISQAFIDALKIPLGGDFDNLMARVKIAGVEPLALVSDDVESESWNLVLDCPKFIWETYIKPHATALVDCLATARITAITLSE